MKKVAFLFSGITTPESTLAALRACLPGGLLHKIIEPVLLVTDHAGTLGEIEVYEVLRLFPENQKWLRHIIPFTSPDTKERGEAMLELFQHRQLDFVCSVDGYHHSRPLAPSVSDAYECYHIRPSAGAEVITVLRELVKDPKKTCESMRHLVIPVAKSIATRELEHRHGKRAA